MIRSIAKLAFIVLLLGHGLIHLLGFLKAFDLAQVKANQPHPNPLSGVVLS